MKKMQIILMIGLVFGLPLMAWSLPMVNTAGDGFEDVGSTPYAYYQNSGDLLFVEPGNNTGSPLNRAWVESLVIDSLGLSPGFELIEDASVNWTSVGGGLSGTWQTAVPSELISFYAVKAGSAFAMYLVDPSDSSGSWSTFDLWDSGLANRGDDLAISHFTGYNASAAPVPEPATMLLLGTGLVGLAGYGRKKIKA